MIRENPNDYLLSVTVGKMLVKKGFFIADCAGKEQPSIFSNEIGILLDEPQKKPAKLPHCLFNFLRPDKKRIFIGTIWFKNELREATHNNWVIDYYNEDHAQAIKDLAAEFAPALKVVIRLRHIKRNNHLS